MAPQSEQILREQVAILYQQNTAMVVVNLAVAGLLIYGFSPIAPQPLLIGWGLMMLTVCAIRVSFWLMYRIRKHNEFSRFYADLFVFGCALSGIVWASASIMFFQPDTVQYQIFMFFVLTGMAAGSLTSLYAYAPAFYAFFLTSFIPMMIWLVLSGSKAQTTLAAFCLIFILGLSYMYMRLNRSLLSSLTLRTKNKELEEQVSNLEQQAEITANNQQRLIELADTNLRPTLHTLSLMVNTFSEANSEQQQRTLATIKSHLNRLNFKFEALQDIAMLEANIIKPEAHSFRVQELMENLAEVFAPVAQKKGLSLAVETADLLVHSDPLILENALRYFVCQSLRQSTTGEISLACHVENSQVVLEIRNSDKNSAAPGTKLKSEVDTVLAMVNQLAELLGHKTESNSYPGLGSVFRVYLPFANSSNNQQPLHLLPVTSTAPDIAPKTVVALVEPDKVAREYTATFYRERGCDVIAEESTQKLLAELKDSELKPNTIIVDAGFDNTATALAELAQIKKVIGKPTNHNYLTTTNKSMKAKQLQLEDNVTILVKPLGEALLNSLMRAGGAGKIGLKQEINTKQLFIHTSHHVD
ncbi:sensor histidine kinase [Saccharophagus degradans]|uniref:HAMP domain-containing sensor histidine kinase n=1 Tax=Saccharophagus degradans TaxID=86304 RepID=A0AAW7X7W2_9GAMM|nr:HAMP domain-containing sensor histidine kinase [Saccharophagus degradans]MDO6423945.1 HAMP domain-containing sensor histidine kinase [Saccharophagus degradans]MDO6609216.1 HAMP domain-containing sensor histidine kinase [Saccharophagus degradans]